MPADGLAVAPAPARRTLRLLGSAKGMAGAVILGLALVVALLGPWLAPHDPAAQVVANRFLPPAWAPGGSWSYLLGGDNLGRDILSRVLVGTRASIAIGFSVVLAAMIVGSLLGALAGYFGGLADSAIMRLVDFQLSFPFILLAIVFMAVWPSTSPRISAGWIS